MSDWRDGEHALVAGIVMGALMAAHDRLSTLGMQMRMPEHDDGGIYRNAIPLECAGEIRYEVVIRPVDEPTERYVPVDFGEHGQPLRDETYYIRVED